MKSCAYPLNRVCRNSASAKRTSSCIRTLRHSPRFSPSSVISVEPKAAKPDSEAIAGPEKRVIQHDADAICRCGNRFEGGEKFCGKCGTARFEELRRGTQSKLASVWYLQQAQSAQATNSRDHEKGEQEEATLAERPVSLEQIIAKLSPE